MSDEQTTTEDTIESPELDAEGSSSAEEATEPQDAEARAQELLARLQHVSADYQNYQKRVQRDKAKWTQDAIRGLLTALLPVLDNVDSAVTACEGEVKDAEALKQGLLMIRDEFSRQMASFKLSRIQAEPGTPFDPDSHEAIMVQPAPEAERKEVLFQARAGYRLGDIVLRPAQVGVRQPAE